MIFGGWYPDPPPPLWDRACHRITFGTKSSTHVKITRHIMQETTILIALAINAGMYESAHMRTFARAFIVLIHVVWIYIKAQTQIRASSFPRYISINVCYRHSRIYDKSQNLDCLHIYARKNTLSKACHT